LLNEAVENTKSVFVSHKEHLDITMKGLVVSEVL